MESTIHEHLEENEGEISDVVPSERKERFRWDKDDKVNNLIRCLVNYKSQMEFANSDFNADKVKQYEAVRLALAKIYESDPSQFGPATLVCSPLFNKRDEHLSEEEKLEKARLRKQQEREKTLVKKGYNRVQEKLKEIRQSFSVAVTTGRCSGSGKVVLEFYDELVQIYGGSPATQPLACGTCTKEINTGNPDEEGLSNEDSLPSPAQQDPPESILAPVQPQPTERNDKDKKRKAASTIPQLIDNKRKHLERQLSANQRDQLLINESKEDSQFKKDIAEAIRQSDKTFANSMQQMSASIVQVGESLARSMEIMSNAFLQQNNQNRVPYHPHHSGYNSGAVINFGTNQFNYESLRPTDQHNEETWTYHPL